MRERPQAPFQDSGSAAARPARAPTASRSAAASISTDRRSVAASSGGVRLPAVRRRRGARVAARGRTRASSARDARYRARRANARRPAAAPGGPCSSRCGRCWSSETLITFAAGGPRRTRPSARRRDRPSRGSGSHRPRASSCAGSSAPGSAGGAPHAADGRSGKPRADLEIGHHARAERLGQRHPAAHAGLAARHAAHQDHAAASPPRAARAACVDRRVRRVRAAAAA